MKGNTRFTAIAALAVLALMTLSGMANAQINCAVGSPNVQNVLVNPGVAQARLNPLINQRHVFCGEINGGNAVGFHSRPASHDPVQGPNITSPIQARTTGPSQYLINPGANHPSSYVYYNPNVEVRNGGGWVAKAAGSTFFPDNCQQNQVVNSIKFAYTHLITMPPGAGGWFVGPSGPMPHDNGYCYANDDQVFYIRGALNNIGGGVGWIINTAHPQ